MNCFKSMVVFSVLILGGLPGQEAGKTGPGKVGLSEKGETRLAELERKITECRISFGQVDPRVALAYSILGDFHNRNGEKEKAQKAAHASLRILEKTEVDGPVALEKPILAAANLMRDLMESEKAALLFRRLLKIQKGLYGRKHRLTAKTIFELGRLADYLGDMAEAGRLLREAEVLYAGLFGPQAVETAEVRVQVGLICVYLGKYGEAENAFTAAMAVLGRESGDDDTKMIKCLTGLYRTKLAMNDYPAAEKFCRRALGAKKKKYGPDSSSYALGLSMLSRIMVSSGDLEEGERLLRSALDILVQGKGSMADSTLTLKNNLADLLKQQGKLLEAERLFREVVRETRKLGKKGSFALGLRIQNYANILAILGKFKESEPLFLESNDLLKKQFGAAHPDYARGLHLFSNVLTKHGKFVEAEDHCRRALAIYEKVFGPINTRNADCLGELAFILDCQRKSREAVIAAERALEIYKVNFSFGHPYVTIASYNAGNVNPDANRCWERLSQAFSGNQFYVKKLFLSAPESSRLQYFRRSAQFLLSLLAVSTHPKLGGRDPSYHDKAYAAMLSLKGLIFRSVSSLQRVAFGKRKKEASPVVDQLRAVQAELSRLVLNNEAGSPGKLSKQADSLTTKRDELEKTLVRMLSGKVVDKEVKIRDLLKKMPPGSVLVDFYFARNLKRNNYIPSDLKGHQPKDYLHIFVLRAGDKNVRRLMIRDTNTLAGSLKKVFSGGNFTRGLKARKSKRSRDKLELLKGLRKQLWDPLRKLVGNAKLVFIVPDLALATVPFGVLVEEDDSFLIEKHSFVYLQCAQSLLDLETKAEPTTTPSLLAVGGVTYDQADKEATPTQERTERIKRSSSVKYPPLPATLGEVEEITRLHAKFTGKASQAHILTGSAATEEEIKTKIPGANVVHLATHGFYEPRTKITTGRLFSRVSYFPGLYSGLVLAGANKLTDHGRDDGFLTAEEVSWLDLSRCDLVVLSACETGLGEARNGEGLLGLRRSFLKAGARTVISSLWKVQDEATRRLMTKFYRRIWREKQGRLEALRGAKLELLAENKENTGSPLPFTWAGFVLSGTWK